MQVIVMKETHARKIHYTVEWLCYSFSVNQFSVLQLRMKGPAGNLTVYNLSAWCLRSMVLTCSESNCWQLPAISCMH